MKIIKKHFSTILIFLFLGLGLSLLLYPTISDYWNSFHQTKAIADYTQAVENLDKEDYEKLWKEAEEYNRKLLLKGNRWKLSQKEKKEYEKLLDVGSRGIIGSVEVPKIDVNLPIYHGVEETILQIAIGHIEGSSLPVGGKSTHCVLSGHRGLPSAKLFTDLDQLEEGDIFILHVLDRTLTYEVDQIRIVEPDNMSELDIQEGRDLCTLVTCTPYGVNSHRLLVRGHRIANLKGNEIGMADAMQIDPMLAAAVIAACILICFGVWVFVHTRTSKRTGKRSKGKGEER